MLLAGGELRAFPGTHGLHRFGDGNGILSCIQHPGETADGVGMALADAPAPEGIVLPLGEDDGLVQPGQGEKARVPAHGDKAQVAPLPGCRIHRGEVLRDAGMGIKGVHHIEELREAGSLLRQVRGAAAADEEHIDLSLQ